jgi:hypothetical protein
MDFELIRGMIRGPRMGTSDDAAMAPAIFGANSTTAQLPPMLSALAISEFFTLDDGEARAVLSQ